MPIPDDIREEAEASIATYCEAAVSADMASEVRIEYVRRGRTFTIRELRPPWQARPGAEWTSLRICDFEWAETTGRWTLHARDRNDRRLAYPNIGPAATLEPLLRELQRDPTGIFWG